MQGKFSIYQLNYISFGFIMMTFYVVWEGQTRNMHLIGQPCLPYGMCKQGQISFKLRWWHLRRLIFCSRRSQYVPLLIRLEMTILHLWSTLLHVPIRISLVMVFLPMPISHWIQMLGPKQGMGKRLVVLAHSNYPFCKKTSGRWDKLLKPHY
jgi:hypothetical protein